jgi:dUTP pyrophosphatase
VILRNAGHFPFTVERGMRIAQAVLAPVVRTAWFGVDVLPETERGHGGFGGTGA